MDVHDIEIAAVEFWQNSPLNIAKDLNDLRMFEKPLIGIGQANDVLFETLKQEDAVGNQHMSPVQWLPDSQSVISYFLPFTKEVRESNRSDGLPSTEWLFGRIEGELFNKALCAFLVSWFQTNGYAALSPVTDKRFQIINRRSNWSERHVAYIAGLGTVSLSCSLITKAGAAGRLGSVIANVPIKPTVRQYNTKDEYCIHCGACIRRCPPVAINQNGKDHKVCSEYLDRVMDRFKPRYGCGKCQTKVPCEDQIPKKIAIV